MTLNRKMLGLAYGGRTSSGRAQADALAREYRRDPGNPFPHFK